MLKHCSFEPGALEMLQALAKKNESVLLVLGHNGNWEWAGNTFSLLAPHQLYVIYHPLSNKMFDRLMYKMRTRFGTRLIAMKDTYKQMLHCKDELTATAFIADQTPAPQTAHWMNFLNQDTPVYLGAEKIAKKFDRNILFVSVKRQKRGYYKIALSQDNVIETHKEKLPEGRITEKHTLFLEADILRDPTTWLWTHRRWKHKRPN